MIAGTPQQLGMQDGILGVSPATCGVINNSLTFVFADVSDSIPDLCWAAAQEPAHSWGLDHQMLCEDPMTYLRVPCGTSKYAFQDVNSPCGEDQNRPCMCGSNTQNSFQRISAIFGTDGADAPELAIVRPEAGATVRPFFVIEAQAFDLSPYGPVELWVNGQMIGSSEFQPYIFNSPEGLANGPVAIEIRATDIHGALGTATVNVTVDDSAPDPGDPNDPNGGDEGGGCRVASGSGGFAGFGIIVFGLAMGRVRRRSRR